MSVKKPQDDYNLYYNFYDDYNLRVINKYIHFAELYEYCIFFILGAYVASIYIGLRAHILYTYFRSHLYFSIDFDYVMCIHVCDFSFVNFSCVNNRFFYHYYFSYYCL